MLFQIQRNATTIETDSHTRAHTLVACFVRQTQDSSNIEETRQWPVRERRGKWKGEWEKEKEQCSRTLEHYQVKRVSERIGSVLLSTYLKLHIGQMQWPVWWISRASDNSKQSWRWGMNFSLGNLWSGGDVMCTSVRHGYSISSGAQIRICQESRELQHSAPRELIWDTYWFGGYKDIRMSIWEFMVVSWFLDTLWVASRWGYISNAWWIDMEDKSSLSTLRMSSSTSLWTERWRQQGTIANKVGKRVLQSSALVSSTTTGNKGLAPVGDDI